MCLLVGIEVAQKSGSQTGNRLVDIVSWLACWHLAAEVQVYSTTDHPLKSDVLFSSVCTSKLVKGFGSLVSESAAEHYGTTRAQSKPVVEPIPAGKTVGM
jgi:hypothetical protein